MAVVVSTQNPDKWKFCFQDVFRLYLCLCHQYILNWKTAVWFQFPKNLFYWHIEECVWSCVPEAPTIHRLKKRRKVRYRRVAIKEDKSIGDPSINEQSRLKYGSGHCFSFFLNYLFKFYMANMYLKMSMNIRQNLEKVWYYYIILCMSL